MKNFDLDQIKNRQLQEMPDHFYEKMQQNVIDKTIVKDKSFEIGKKSNFNWYYAAAASLAILFGGTYFFYNEDVVENPLVATQTVSESIPKQNNTEENTQVLTVAELNNDIEIIPITQKEKDVNNAPKKVSKAIAGNNSTKKTAKPEDQIDFLLENFTAEELATLAKNSDKDVYLDLYN